MDGSDRKCRNGLVWGFAKKNIMGQARVFPARAGGLLTYIADFTALTNVCIKLSKFRRGFFELISSLQGSDLTD